MNTVQQVLRIIGSVLNAIPGAFWGVVVGSFFSLAGVALTNRAADQRLRTQLESDRQLRNKERELALRKEIYMGAAEAFQAGVLAINYLANMDLSQQDIEKTYLEKAPALSKMYIIATQETLSAMIPAASLLSNALLELMAKRTPLTFLKSQVAVLDGQIADVNAEGQRLIHLLTEHNIEGNPDQRRFQVIQRNFQFQQQRLKQDIEKRMTLQRQLVADSITFAKECHAASKEVSNAIVPVIVAVRSDLDLPIEADLYSELIQRLQHKTQESIDRFFDQIQQQLTDYAAAASFNNNPDDGNGIT